MRHQRGGKRYRSIIDVRQQQTKHLRAREAIKNAGMTWLRAGQKRARKGCGWMRCGRGAGRAGVGSVGGLKHCEGRVDELLSDQGLHQRMSEEAFKYAKRNWSAKDQAKKLISFYSSVKKRYGEKKNN